MDKKTGAAKQSKSSKSPAAPSKSAAKSDKSDSSGSKTSKPPVGKGGVTAPTLSSDINVDRAKSAVRQAPASVISAGAASTQSGSHDSNIVVVAPVPSPNPGGQYYDCPYRFVAYTPQSHLATQQRLRDQKRKDKEKLDKATRQEAKLVDGQVVVDDGEDAIEKDPELADGNFLAKNIATQFPIDLIRVPLEEIEEWNRQYDQTFLVIAKRFGKVGFLYRFSSTSALYILKPLNPLRRAALWLYTHFLFDIIVILTILANAVYMATNRNDAAPEKVFLAIYTLEMVIKIGARGFVINTHTYLRDPWNWLDFFVIISSYTTIVIENSGSASNIDLGPLRTFRVFRVLKTIAIVPGLKTIINALLNSMRMLGEVIGLTVFFMTLFALVGLQIYMGKLRQKCVLDIDPYVAANNSRLDTLDSYFRHYIANSSNWYPNGDEPLLCGNISGAQLCPENTSCMPDVGDNPNWGYTNFDHFGWGLLSSFQLLTLDFWEDTYMKIIATSGPWNVLFFMVIVFFGSFYLINLMLAVVTMSYSEEAKEEKDDAAKGEFKPRFVFDPEKLRTLQSSHTMSDRSRASSAAARTAIERGTEKHLQRTAHVDVKPVEETKCEVPIPPSTELQLPVAHVRPVAVVKPQPSPKPERRDSTASSMYYGLKTPELTDVGYSVRSRPLSGISVGRQGYWDRNCLCCSRQDCCFLPWLHLQNKLYVIVTDPFFEMWITLCIILNTLCMAISHHGMPEDLAHVLEYANNFFTAVFILEAILKLIALSRTYFQSGWNILDLVVVIGSVVDFVFTYSPLRTMEIGIDASIIRILRLLRVLKLAQSWKAMRKLLEIIFSTFGALGNVTVVLIICIFIFAVIGMQLFSKKYTAEIFGEEIPRWNFNDFGHAFMMIFRVLCGEWIEPLWDCMRASGQICVPIFIAALVFGNFIVLNLFLALLLNAFGADSLEEPPKEEEEESITAQRWRRFKAFLAKKFGRKIATEQSLVVTSPGSGETTTSKSVRITEPQEETNTNTPNLKKSDSQSTLADADGAPRLYDCLPIFCQKYKCTSRVTEFDCYPNFIKVREALNKVVSHFLFEGFILFLIGASSLTLCFEDIYLDERPELKLALEVLDYVFLGLFTIEMIFKLLAFGVKKYFTTFWTLLDFLIVASGYLDLFMGLIGNSQLSSLNALRTLRALRPLRAVSRWEGMKLVVNALMYAVPGIINVFLVMIVFWLIFAIMGVDFFGGKFQKCVDLDGNKMKPSEVANMTDCLHQNMTWKNSNINFDYVLAAYLALFQVATFEGWMEIMEDAVDAPTKIGDQPSFENSVGYYVYFVAFIIFGSFFLLNLFIGVIIENFNSQKKSHEGGVLNMFLTEDQKHFYNTIRKLGVKKPRKTIARPKGTARAWFYDMAVSVRFDLNIALVIVINMLVMCAEHYHQSATFTKVQEILNLVFTSIFTFEMILKMTGLRWHYFRKPWNVFDFIVVVLSILGIVISDILSNYFVSPSLLRVVRVLRIGRVLRLIKSAKGIRKLMFSLMISLPALFNICCLLFMVMFIYAIIGMSQFSRLKHQLAIDDITNFESFGQTMVLLFRICTSAGWNDVLEAMLVQPPDCDPDFWHHPYQKNVTIAMNGGNCSDWGMSVIYMVTYLMLTFLIMTNMYIAVILENFQQAHEQEEIGVTEDDIEMFYSVWELFDPTASQFLKWGDMSEFVSTLEPPLGLPKPNDLSIVLIDFPIMKNDEGEEVIHCLDVLMGLVRKALGNADETEEFKEMKKHLEEAFRTTFPNRVKLVQHSSSKRRKAEDVAARTLQRAWRNHRAQKAIRKQAAKQGAVPK